MLFDARRGPIVARELVEIRMAHPSGQRRLDGVRLTAGAFLNLGRDHFDYHPTVEDYLAAKLRLFTTLLPDGTTDRALAVLEVQKFGANIIDTPPGLSDASPAAASGPTSSLPRLFNFNFSQN